MVKYGTKNFALYKGKIIPQCSLELDDSKNIYFSYVIFNIFRRNTPLFPIFCKIYQTLFLDPNMNQGVDVLHPLLYQSPAESVVITDMS